MCKLILGFSRTRIGYAADVFLSELCVKRSVLVDPLVYWHLNRRGPKEMAMFKCLKKVKTKVKPTAYGASTTAYK